MAWILGHIPSSASFYSRSQATQRNYNSSSKWLVMHWAQNKLVESTQTQQSSKNVINWGSDHTDSNSVFNPEGLAEWSVWASFRSNEIEHYYPNKSSYHNHLNAFQWQIITIEALPHLPKLDLWVLLFPLNLFYELSLFSIPYVSRLLSLIHSKIVLSVDVPIISHSGYREKV